MRQLPILAALASILLVLMACSADVIEHQIGGTLDVSKTSAKLSIQDAYMNKDFGIYGTIDNMLGIVVPGHVENGRVHENSNMLFVDENGKILYIDTLFRVEIILKQTGSEYETKRQSFAESGDDVLLYFRYEEDDVLAHDAKYAELANLMRVSQFAIVE